MVDESNFIQMPYLTAPVNDSDTSGVEPLNHGRSCLNPCHDEKHGAKSNSFL